MTLRLGDDHVTTLGGEMQGGCLSLQHRGQADDSSTFTVVPLDNSEVALKSKLNGKFLMVDQSTNGPAGPNYHLRAGASETGPWEKFTLDRLSDGTTALKSSSTGKYVRDAAGTLTGYGEQAQAAHINIAPANPGFPLHPTQP
ncbi:fascin domain-containing protein [Streptomyces sp. NPDC001774]